MGLSPAQPARPLRTASFADAAAMYRDEFILAGYRRSGTPLPIGGASLPTVRIHFKPAAGGVSASARSASRIGPGLDRGAMATRAPTPSARVSLLCPPPDVSADVIAAAAVGDGVVDPNDGIGGRVVRLASGDELYVPGREVGRADREDVVLAVGPVASDGVEYLAEVSL